MAASPEQHNHDLTYKHSHCNEDTYLYLCVWFLPIAWMKNIFLLAGPPLHSRLKCFFVLLTKLLKKIIYGCWSRLRCHFTSCVYCCKLVVPPWDMWTMKTKLSRQWHLLPGNWNEKHMLMNRAVSLLSHLLHRVITPVSHQQGCSYYSFNRSGNQFCY